MRLPPPLSLLLDLFISPEMKWSIRMMTITWKPSKREHREWIFNRGLTSCCCYLFLYCCPPPFFPPTATTGWMDVMDPHNLVITQCDSAIGDRSEHKTFCKPQNNPLCTTPLLTSISTSHYCADCHHSKWSNGSMGRAANCILRRPPR